MLCPAAEPSARPEPKINDINIRSMFWSSSNLNDVSKERGALGCGTDN
jgi:hypothetical protein